MIGDKTNLGNLDQKIEMLEAHFNQCIQDYHEPLPFMAQVDSMIQGLRNYTFAVQANKGHIPDFEKWYGPWQERMKNDSYMRWLQRTRTRVVHEDVLTTKSNATLTFHTDHTQTVIREHYDIMTSSAELMEDAKELAQRRPELRHATCNIERHYIFDVDGESVEALDVLSTCFVFMQDLWSDLAQYLKGGKILSGELPLSHEEFRFPVDKLNLMFKLRDGSILTESAVRFNRDDSPETLADLKKHYGDLHPSNKLGSTDKLEVARAFFEIARLVFETDGHHKPMMHVHDKNGWLVVMPVFRDRAEKIALWRGFASKVKSRGVDEIIFIAESWILSDLDKIVKHLQAGKEVKSLRQKEEALILFYLNDKGRVILIFAPITREHKKAILGETYEGERKPEDLPIFYPVFAEWGLIDMFKIKVDADSSE